MSWPIELVRRLASSRLVCRPVPLDGWLRVVAWWELRRAPYNLIVGATGVAVCALLLACGTVCERVLGDPIGIPDPPLFAVIGVLLYGLVANICYSGGWILELIVIAVWREVGTKFGEVAFTLGLLFSVLLTTLPALIVLPVAAVRLISHYAKGG